MTAALWEALRDLAAGIGFVGLGVFGYFLLVGVLVRAWNRGLGGEAGRRQRDAEDLQARLLAMEARHREEIACMGGRRLPEAPR